MVIRRIFLLLIFSNTVSLSSSSSGSESAEISFSGATLEAVSSLISHFPIFAGLPPTSSPSALPPSASSSKGGGGGGGSTSSPSGKGSYRKMGTEFVRLHNAVRSVLGESPLKWNKRLAAHAQAYSETLVRNNSCKLVHSNGSEGENLFWGSGWDWRAFDAVKSWAYEAVHYDIENNTCAHGKMCGHFTQVVWNSTKSVGCGRAECPGGGVIITCRYHPAGNFLGERPFLLKY